MARIGPFLIGGIPGPPTIVTADSGCGYIDLEWSRSFTAQNYKIYRNGELATSTSDTTWRDSAIQYFEHCYEIAAENYCGEGSYSSPVCILSNVFRPAPPALIWPTDGYLLASSSDSLKWSTVEGAQRYSVAIDDDSLLQTPQIIDTMIVSTEYPLAALQLEQNVTHYWAIRALNDCGWSDWGPVWSFALSTTDVSQPESGTLPMGFSLGQNYPNPFNPETRIQFTLSFAAEVSLAIYNVNGTKVRTLLDKSLPSGEFAVVWDGKDQAGRSSPSGLYFYRLTVADREYARSMLLIR